MARSHANALRLRQVLRLFALFGNSSRVVIFQRLAHAPGTAGDLAKHLPISRPGIVQHLKQLEVMGLVAATMHGKRRVYRVTPEGLRPLHEWLAAHSPSAPRKRHLSL